MHVQTNVAVHSFTMLYQLADAQVRARKRTVLCGYYIYLDEIGPN